jgi:putative transposase
MGSIPSYSTRGIIGWSYISGQIQKFLNRVKGSEELKEIPKSQRYIGRPGLAELLKGTKGRKEISRKAKETIEKYGYSQKEVADYLGIHYSTVSRLVNKGILDYARNKT